MAAPVVPVDALVKVKLPTVVKVPEVTIEPCCGAPLVVLFVFITTSPPAVIALDVKLPPTVEILTWPPVAVTPIKFVGLEFVVVVVFKATLPPIVVTVRAPILVIVPSTKIAFGAVVPPPAVYVLSA